VKKQCRVKFHRLGLWRDGVHFGGSGWKQISGWAVLIIRLSVFYPLPVARYHQKSKLKVLTLYQALLYPSSVINGQEFGHGAGFAESAFLATVGESA
jgi:hypothetical protein